MTRLWLGLSLWLSSNLFLPLPQAHAELQFTQTTLKLGKIKCGVPVEQVFSFVVAGKEPVEIQELRAGCGCVSSELTKKQFTSGEKGAITLSLHTLGEAEGPHRWYLYVFYHQSGKQQQVALEILAEVEAEILIRPAKLNIHTSGPLTQLIRVTDTRPQPFALQKVLSSNPLVPVVVGKPSRDEHGHWTIALEVQIGADLPAGKTETLVSLYTDDPAYRQLQVPVVVTKPTAQRFIALPAKVQFVGVRGQPLPNRLLQLRQAQDEPVLIERLTPGHPALSCHWAKGPGNLATVKIQVDATQLPPDRLETTLTIELAGPDRETVTIPVTCELE